MKAHFQEISSSIETAIDKHPQITKYFICVPRNLSDSRINRTQTERQKWESSLVDWKSQDPKVDFVLWGSFEIIKILSNLPI
jgi:hypothetical protein